MAAVILLDAHRFARMGDIGDDQREWEFDPISNPAEEPVVAPEPEPAREPVPA